MFVDASAIVAILAREDDGPEFVAQIRDAHRVLTSPLAVYEAVLGLARARRMTTANAQIAVEGFIAEVGAQIIPVTPEIGRIALDAFARYGRGNHPARLNMGDCFAYACARSLGVPLLFKGDDFSQTDIAAA
jgi:ribonuclease VapC